MATREEMMLALKNADAAGDTEAATRIARMIHEKIPDVSPAVSATAPGMSAPPAPPPEKESRDYIKSLSPVSGAEAALNLGSSMIAKPVSDVVGLGGVITHALGLTDANPGTTKDTVQRSLTYLPKTRGGKFAAEYNPLALAGKTIGAGADIAGSVAQDLTDSEAMGNFTREAIPQAIGLLGAKGVAGAPAKAQANALALRKTSTQDAAIRAGQKLGFKASPSEVGAGALSRTAESFGGESAVHHANSVFNKPVANDVARKYLSLPEDAPLTKTTFKAARKAQYAPYEAMKKSGDIMTDIPIPPIVGDFSTLHSPITGKKSYSINAEKAVEQVKQLRSRGFKLKKKASKDSDPAIESQADEMLGAADTLDDILMGHAVKLGKPELASNLAKARVEIAKTHTVENATRGGNLEPVKVMKLYEKGVPMSGDLKAVAEFTQQAQRSMNTPKGGAHVPLESPGFIGTIDRWLARQASKGILGVVNSKKQVSGNTPIASYAATATSQLRDQGEK